MNLLEDFMTMLALLVLFSIRATAQSCSVAPFAVQLKNCTFASGVVSWGNLIEIGSPPQRVCLVPSTVVNSTLVSQRTLCTKSNTLAINQCESLRGGFYNENSSTTWVGSSLSNYNDTKSNPTWDHFNAPGLTKVGYETLRFPGSTDVQISGAGVALNQYGNNSNAGMIGLGKDSVFLEDAVFQNKSPSRSWSLDSGSLSLVKPRNGELVIGGYNKARLDGSFRWANISDMSGERPCPLRTVIKEMTVLLPNGSSYPLKSSAEDITACIEPYDNLFRFTPGMLLNWKQYTGFDESLSNIYSNPTEKGLSFTELGLPYVNQNIMEWSLTITLDTGYSTTLPHYEIQKPLTGWNVVGDKETVPGIGNVAILNAPTAKGEIPTLGKIFLSRSYLAVDYEANKFGLAEASTDPGPAELIGLSCGSAKNKTSSSSNSPSSTKVPLGAIIGASIGGAAVLILAIALFICLRRRSRQKAEPAPPVPVYEFNQMYQEGSGYPHGHPSQSGYYSTTSQPPFSPKSGHSWVDEFGNERQYPPPVRRQSNQIYEVSG